MVVKSKTKKAQEPQDTEINKNRYKKVIKKSKIRFKNETKNIML